MRSKNKKKFREVQDDSPRCSLKAIVFRDTIEAGFRKGAEKVTNFGSFACGPVGGNVFLEMCVCVCFLGGLPQHAFVGL